MHFSPNSTSPCSVPSHPRSLSELTGNTTIASLTPRPLPIRALHLPVFHTPYWPRESIFTAQLCSGYMTPHCQETKALLHRGGEKQWGGDGREGEGGVGGGSAGPDGPSHALGFPLESLLLPFLAVTLGRIGSAPQPPRAPLLPFGFLVQVISMRQGWSCLWVQCP